jgi:hypothetical protein
MSIADYLESEELREIVRYHSDMPQNAVSFAGTLRKHPYDEAKCILIAAPSGCEPAIFEFRTADILGVEELPSPVDEAGQTRSLVKLWVKRGSFGIRYEPFEVDDPPRSPRDSSHLRDRILKSARCWG